MLRILPISGHRKLKVILASLLSLFVVADAVAQCGFATLKGTRRPNIGVAGGYYNGVIEWLPTDYLSNPTKTYPVIIYFPGHLASGNGSLTDLCKVITDLASAPADPRPTHLLDNIERGTWGADIVPTVGTTSFIVIGAQYASYGAPYQYSTQTHALIDWVVDNYRVDESRIYLTGVSTGANQAMDYISSSLVHAQRIAAASFGTSCLPTSLVIPQGPANVANGGVATWFVHCADEIVRTGYNPNTCVLGTTTDWVDAINAQSPTIAPRMTILNSVIPPATPAPGTYPQNLNWCKGYSHDGWSSLHSPDFAPLDGGPNFYSWALQFQAESALPIVLKSFTARLSNGKVYLRWVTSSEQDNEAFVLERAGNNSQFSAIGTITGGGNTSGDKVYEYIDERPLANLSFYRLKQQDVSGRQRYFETRKVMNRGQSKKLIIITPNPFSTDPSVFISVDKKQKVSVWLTDMSGRVLSSVNGVFDQGTTELSLPAGELPRGIYLIKAAGENIRETQKIIKQ